MPVEPDFDDEYQPRFAPSKCPVLMDIALVEHAKPMHAWADVPPTSGARVIFDGIVRNHDHGAEVSYLVYSAHPECEHFLERVVEATVTKIKAQYEQEYADKCQEAFAQGQAVPQWRHGLDHVFVRHRIGTLEIGESALVVVVDAGHRGLAFHTCEQIVDAIKAGVPIWKQQFYVDGTHDWSNLP